MIIRVSKNDFVNIKELENKFPEVLKKDSIKIDFERNPYTNYLVYKLENQIVGFLNYNDIYERIEIVNFNVLPDFQNQHIGTKLLVYLIEIALDNKKKNITLEVRKDNKKAIYLYQKNGFLEVGIRKNYYGNIDGILMEKELM